MWFALSALQVLAVCVCFVYGLNQGSEVPMEALRMTPPDEDEIAAATELLRQLETLGSSLIVRSEDGDTGQRVELPDSAVRVLIQVLAHIANGDGVAVVPVHAELTTQQAAEILHVSRPHLVKLLDEGVMPSRKVGTHRRVMLTDVLVYRDADEKKRQAVLAELTQDAEDMGLYD